MRRTAAACLLAAGLALAGCSIGSTATPDKAAATTSTITPGPFAGFGTTQAEWERHHVNDIGLDHSGYDPDPSGHDTYSVTWISGRALNYELALTPQTVQQAIARVRRELPADAILVHQGAANGCYNTLFSSKTLDKELAPLGLRPGHAGEVDVNYETFSMTAATSYDPKRINDVSLSLIPPAGTDEPGCGAQT
jgi:hypothetical protein